MGGSNAVGVGCVARTMVALACACLLGAAVAQATPRGHERVECTTGVVQTAAGPVCGLTLDGGVEAFLGVPFAETTGGENRFEPPVPKAPWEETLAATAFGPFCPQGSEVHGWPMSEDCLTLNVWRPAGATGPLPVLVFVHGGAFVMGGSMQGLLGTGPVVHDGAYLAGAHDLLVVTVQYRLGALGFFGGLPGRQPNLALLDQQLALRWVQENIAAFGGNPAHVTLAGESAGATSVIMHLYAMPSSEDLFHAAIVESAPLGLPHRTLDDARAGGELFMMAVGCRYRFDQLGCLKQAPLEVLLEAQANPTLRLSILERGLAGFLSWAPVVDGELVVEQPMRAALERGTTKPLLIGFNSNEGTVFIAGGGDTRVSNGAYDLVISVLFGSVALRPVKAAYPPTGTGDNLERVVEIATDYMFVCPTLTLAQAARGPTYLYEFRHVPTSNVFPEVERCAEEACHAAELPFVFRSAGDEVTFTAEEDELSRQMAEYWGRFSRGLSDPNRIGGPRWPELRSTGELLLLGVPLATAPLASYDCTLWDGLGYPISRDLTAD